MMQNTIAGRSIDDFAPNTLPRMFGALRQEQLAGPSAPRGVVRDQHADEAFKLHFDTNGKTLMINGIVEIKGATCALLFTLAEGHLYGAGHGLQFEDYPTLSAGDLSEKLKLGSEESVRRRITRSRTSLRQKLSSAGVGLENGSELIENLPWHGYRLTPDSVTVLIG